MEVPYARSGMEIIPRAECLRLLAGQEVGRLAFVVSGHPMVLPVNYVVVGDVVVFRTGEGLKLDTVPSAEVAFEVDEVDVGTRSGWSIVVQGVAEEITEDDGWLAQSLREAAPSAWVPRPADHYMRIRPRVISGRRLRGATGA